MTAMKRICVSLPQYLDRRILNLRKEDRFIRCSYAEIVRTLLESALDGVEQTNQEETTH